MAAGGSTTKEGFHDDPARYGRRWLAGWLVELISIFSRRSSSSPTSSPTTVAVAKYCLFDSQPTMDTANATKREQWTIMFAKTVDSDAWGQQVEATEGYVKWVSFFSSRMSAQ